MLVVWFDARSTAAGNDDDFEKRGERRGRRQRRQRRLTSLSKQEDEQEEEHENEDEDEVELELLARGLQYEMNSDTGSVVCRL